MTENEPKKGTRISILLYIPGQIVLKIGASSNAHVSALRKALPKNQEFNLYYEGTLLNDVFTLSAYGVKNLDVILALHPNSRTDININWLKNSSPEVLMEKLEQAKNYSCRQEMLRLNDLQMSKIDFSQHQFQRFARSISAPSIPESDETAGKVKSPSDIKTCNPMQGKDPLPCFWVETPYDGPLCPDEEIQQLIKKPH